jgi:lipopolysaccharide/colanic/teichoic acid biosynthesis glycosyltransferase
MPTFPAIASQIQTQKTRSSYKLRWRRGQLLVTPSLNSASLRDCNSADQQWLIKRLKHSPIKLVRLDPDLGHLGLNQWADASDQAKKAAYLWLPQTRDLSPKCKLFSWHLKRSLDWLTAFLLLLVLSPMLIGLAIAIRISSPGSMLVWQWHVGERGRLFRAYKLRTTITMEGLNSSPVSPIGVYIQRHRLDKLPLVLNILRGEMSFVGPYPRTLADAALVHPDLRHCLNALPGMTEPKALADNPQALDLGIRHPGNLNDLRSWSLRRDLKSLLSAIPKLISKSGVY